MHLHPHYNSKVSHTTWYHCLPNAGDRKLDDSDQSLSWFPLEPLAVNVWSRTVLITTDIPPPEERTKHPGQPVSGFLGNNKVGHS